MASPDCRLILVEGLPGSGKSTTAQYVYDQVRRNGGRARWYYEDETPHPVAATKGVQRPRGFKEFSQAALARWRDLVSRTRRSGETAIIDAHFFQDTIIALLRANVKRALIADHIRAVAEICQPLQPSLVYLHQPEYAAALRRLLDQRGERIEQLYIHRNDHSRYAQRRNLSGFDGLVHFYLDMRAMMEQLVEGLDMPSLSIDCTDRDWPAYYGKAGEFLALSPQTAEVPSGDRYLSQYAGTYTYRADRSPRRVAGRWQVGGTDWRRRVGGQAQPAAMHYGEDVEFHVRLESGELVLLEYGWLWPVNRLVPKEEDVFYIAGWPFTMDFERDPSGAVVGARQVNLAGRWLATGQRYPRVAEGPPD